MKLAKILTPLVFALPLINCHELETKVMKSKYVKGNLTVISRAEYKKTIFEVEREILAKYSRDDPDSKYINHEYYPILEMSVSFPMDHTKNSVHYLDEKYGTQGTPMVDAYWDGEKWVQRSAENELLFLKYDKDFLELKDLLDVDNIVKKD
ncbi:hypothetical protein HY837_01835 [archaeon]|nr:hypothetical protein [archaeon]